jgi:two-component system, cell cycle response regulator
VRIALVEPSRTVRRIVAQTITSWGHDVRAFSDANEALGSLAADKNVCALITSIELPASSGIELVKSARGLAGTQRPLYIMVMSSSEARSKVVEALDSGADDFISKPPELSELRARLRAADRITSMQNALIELATTGVLTGLLNRRAFVERLEDQIKYGSTKGRISVLIADLDQFKSINDTFGHEVGDRVLKAASTELKALNLPAGRLGGEEFAVLMKASLDDAKEAAEHLRKSISNIIVPADTEAIKVTCSIGVTEWEPGDTVDSILRRADIALYEAKRSGRNCVIAADEFLISDTHRLWRGVAREGKRP